MPPGVVVGESWEVADLLPGTAPTVGDGRTRVVGGPYDGWDLERLIAALGEDLLGSAHPTPEGRFPLLVKILDAAENLSVQVHPPASYVERHPGTSLKTESWYVTAAKPESVVYLGVTRGWSHEQVLERFGSPRVAEALRAVPARPGAFFHLPAGMLHALGAGVMVIEVQTPSDTTFRVYDWSDHLDRARRELHVSEAAEAFVLEPVGAIEMPPGAGEGSRVLTVDRHYRIVEHRGVGVQWVDRELRIVMTVSGSTSVGGLECRAGSTVLVPAGAAPITPVTCSTGAIWLEVGLGQPVAEIALPNASMATSTSS